MMRIPAFFFFFMRSSHPELNSCLPLHVAFNNTVNLKYLSGVFTRLVVR